MTKKMILSLLVSVCAFAQESVLAQPEVIAEIQRSAVTQIINNQPLTSEELKSPSKDLLIPKKKGIVYFRAITDSQPVNGAEIFPGLGLGYRRSFGHSGVDISVNYSQGDGWGKKHRQIVWSAPKVSYLHYFSPAKDQTLYGGAGLAWGGTKTKGSEFVGLVPSATLGYEMLRQSIMSSFTELTVSQPLIPSYFKGKIPGPAIELSVGAGF